MEIPHFFNFYIIFFSYTHMDIILLYFVTFDSWFLLCKFNEVWKDSQLDVHLMAAIHYHLFPIQKLFYIVFTVITVLDRGIVWKRFCRVQHEPCPLCWRWHSRFRTIALQHYVCRTAEKARVTNRDASDIRSGYSVSVRNSCGLRKGCEALLMNSKIVLGKMALYWY